MDDLNSSHSSTSTASGASTPRIGPSLASATLTRNGHMMESSWNRHERAGSSSTVTVPSFYCTHKVMCRCKPDGGPNIFSRAGCRGTISRPHSIMALQVLSQESMLRACGDYVWACLLFQVCTHRNYAATGLQTMTTDTENLVVSWMSSHRGPPVPCVRNHSMYDWICDSY